jgi:1,4-dihydroxy-2-naphthoate octaprenyltransferase
VVALGRPLFLVGGAVFYGLGVAAAAYDGAGLSLGLAGWGYLTVAAAQLMNHYSNDYFDLEADMANSVRTRWAGGSRVLAEGRLPPRVALWAALACGAMALLLALGVAAAAPAPWATLALLLCAIGLAWVYSGPPLQLHRRGLGEPVGAVVIVGLTAVTGYLLQAGRLGPSVLLAVVPLCLLQLAMLIAVSVPDAAGDAAVGKRTLTVLLGPLRAAWLYAGAVALAYAALPGLALLGLPWPVALAPLGAAPIACWNVWRALRGGWRDAATWEGLGFWSIGQLVASAGLMLLGFVWSR